MGDPLVTALIVSGIGLLMLFAALAFLYGLMYAMTAFLKDRLDTKEEEPVPVARADERAMYATRRAAAVAVALARAELESSQAASPEAEAGSSPWGQYHRHRQLSLSLSRSKFCHSERPFDFAQGRRDESQSRRIETPSLRSGQALRSAQGDKSRIY